MPCGLFDIKLVYMDDLAVLGQDQGQSRFYFYFTF